MKPIKFKLGIITQEVLGLFLGSLLAGCSTAIVLPHPVKSTQTTVTVTMPDNAHWAWCKGPETDGCFEAAAAMCSDDSVGVGGVVPQHPKPGKFHQVPESDMTFPAMIQEANGGWRMLFVCD